MISSLGHGVDRNRRHPRKSICKGLALQIPHSFFQALAYSLFGGATSAAICLRFRAAKRSFACLYQATNAAFYLRTFSGGCRIKKALQLPVFLVPFYMRVTIR
jgi:hypothetical protein